MKKISLYCHFLWATALLASAESADEMNHWLKPIREVIFISEWAVTPKDVAFVKLSLLDNSTAKVSESTSEQVPIGLSPMKKPNAMTERNLWKMSPGAEKSKEMSCITHQGYFVVISSKEVYTELKAYVPALVADSVSDRLFDSNEFVLVDAWRKARAHLKNNPKLLA